MNEHHLTILSKDPALSLSKEERTHMRAYLETLTTAMPLPARVFERALPSPFFIFMARPMPLMAFALLLIVSGGSAAFAANSALPGEPLYAVKVRVNEPLETYLAPSPVAKANAEVGHAEERLREAEVLAAKGTLDTEDSETAAANVAASVENARAIAVTLADAGNAASADDISAHVSAVLDAHAELLDAQSDDASGSPQAALRTLASAVSTAAGDTHADAGTSLAFQDTAGARAQAALASVENRLAKNGVPQETQEDIAQELGKLQEKFDAAASDADGETKAMAYAAIEKRAYRAYALLSSAQNIQKETGKDVLVTLGSDDTDAVPAVLARPAVAAKMMTMSAMAPALSATTTEEASTSLETTNGETTLPVQKLEFRIRSRSGN